MRDYNVIIGSPVDYEELTADIVINKEYIVRIQKEEGNDKMIVEFYEEPVKTKIYLTDFIEALQDAQQLLTR